MVVLHFLPTLYIYHIYARHITYGSIFRTCLAKPFCNRFHPRRQRNRRSQILVVSFVQLKTHLFPSRASYIESFLKLAFKMTSPRRLEKQELKPLKKLCQIVPTIELRVPSLTHKRSYYPSAHITQLNRLGGRYVMRQLPGPAERGGCPRPLRLSGPMYVYACIRYLAFSVMTACMFYACISRRLPSCVDLGDDFSLLND